MELANLLRTLVDEKGSDLFISVHVNSSPSTSPTARGTETYVQGPGQNRENLEVAKRENDKEIKNKYLFI